MPAQKPESPPNRAALNTATSLLKHFGERAVVVTSSGMVIADTQTAQGEAPARSLDDLPPTVASAARQALEAGQGERSETTSAAGTRVGKARAVPFKLGDEAAVLVVFSDTRQGFELERNLQRLDRLAHAGTLAAGLAHEMRNALVASRTFVDLLLEKNQDAELADVVRRELIRLDSLITRILKFAAPPKSISAPVHIHTLLEHCLLLVQPQLKSRGIIVHRSFSADPDLVQGDEYQLEQVFANLFLNALEALGSEGNLSLITTSVSGLPNQPGSRAHICIVVQDDGSGITDEDLKRLFEPFFTTKPEGTGLGLAMTQRIIAEHGGQISVESRIGQGTAVRLLIPLVDSDSLSDGPG